ncbi:MAG: hypothetical protein MZW92_40610, partial [Comamonadaceae bacterium]|nr:hypothetical protein [Comamonadaceae bacterium]
RDVAIKVLPEAFARGRRAPRPLRARGAGARLAQPPEHRRDLRPRGGRRRRRVLVDGAGRGRGPRRSGSSAGRSRSTRRSPIARADRRGARGGARARASSTATSSPPTSRSRADGTVKVLDFGLAKALRPTRGAGVAADLVARRRRSPRAATAGRA